MEKETDADRLISLGDALAAWPPGWNRPKPRRSPTVWPKRWKRKPTLTGLAVWATR